MTSADRKNVFGASCMVAGVILVMCARNIAYSLGGKLQYLFTGSPGDKPVYLWVGGGALIVIGVYQVFLKQK